MPRGAPAAHNAHTAAQRSSAAEKRAGEGAREKALNRKRGISGGWRVDGVSEAAFLRHPLRLSLQPAFGRAVQRRAASPLSFRERWSRTCALCELGHCGANSARPCVFAQSLVFCVCLGFSSLCPFPLLCAFASLSTNGTALCLSVCVCVCAVNSAAFALCGSSCSPLSSAALTFLLLSPPSLSAHHSAAVASEPVASFHERRTPPAVQPLVGLRRRAPWRRPT